MNQSVSCVVKMRNPQDISNNPILNTKDTYGIELRTIRGLNVRCLMTDDTFLGITKLKFMGGVLMSLSNTVHTRKEKYSI